MALARIWTLNARTNVLELLGCAGVAVDEPHAGMAPARTSSPRTGLPTSTTISRGTAASATPHGRGPTGSSPTPATRSRSQDSSSAWSRCSRASAEPRRADRALDAGSLDAVPIRGGPALTLTAAFGPNGYSQAGSLALDNDHVYFFAGSEFGTYGLLVRSKNANDTRAFEPDDGQINSGGSVATDPTCVYWTSATQLWKAPLATP